MPKTTRNPAARKQKAPASAATPPRSAPAINATPEIRTVALSLLKPAPYNPRRIDPAALAGLEKSLERFGVVEPIIWNERTGFVVGGHQRLKVLRAKKVREAAVVVVDLDEPDEKALNIALNSPQIAGEFTHKLEDLLTEIERDREQVFAELRLGELRGSLEARFVSDGLDDAPPIPKNPITKIGDVWVLDRHRLICGDSTDRATLATLLGDERVDSLVTDPPYGVDYGAKNAFLNEYAKTTRNVRGKSIEKRIEGDLQVRGGYRAWFASWLRLAPWSDYATFYVFMSDRESHNMRNAIDDLGYNFGALLAWVKNSPVFGRTDYAFQHELITYGWPERHRFYADGKPTTVLEYARPSKSELHPTMKPIALLEQLLGDGSADGAIILDLFGGSGSTLIACEASHRRARLVEIDPAYCDVICERWAALTGGKPQRIPAKAAA